MEFTNDELSLIDNMLDEYANRMRHTPDEFTPDEVEAFDSISEKFNTAFKAAGFWWAR